MNSVSISHETEMEENVWAGKYRLKERIQLIKSRLPIHIRLSGNARAGIELGDGEGDGRGRQCNDNVDRLSFHSKLGGSPNMTGGMHGGL